MSETVANREKPERGDGSAELAAAPRVTGPTFPRTAVFGFALPADGRFGRVVVVIADDGTLWETNEDEAGEWAPWQSLPPLPTVDLQAVAGVPK